MITWDNREEWLKLIPRESGIRFGLFCARQIQHEWRMSGNATHAISMVEKWLKGEAQPEECDLAGREAFAAISCYRHAPSQKALANAISVCASVARQVVWSAPHRKITAFIPRYAMAGSADVISAFADPKQQKEAKQEQVEYLRTLYLENLPEEVRNCWLVQACL